MLAVMFSGRHPFSKDREGRYFIDRDGQYFGHILSYLRSDALPPEDVAQFVLREAEFFCLQVCTYRTNVKVVTLAWPSPFPLPSHP